MTISTRATWDADRDEVTMDANERASKVAALLHRHRDLLRARFPTADYPVSDAQIKAAMTTAPGLVELELLVARYERHGGPAKRERGEPT